jgi:predicted transcriptional regulator
MKKAIAVEVDENLWDSLDEFARSTGRKKNILVAAALYEFLKCGSQLQEQIIRQYLTNIKE